MNEILDRNGMIITDEDIAEDLQRVWEKKIKDELKRSRVFSIGRYASKPSRKPSLELYDKLGGRAERIWYQEETA